MGKQVKLPNIDFTKVENSFIRMGKDAGQFIGGHAPKFLEGTLSVIIIDNLRVRIGRKKDQKAFEEFFEENMVKQQQIIRKHEAEINVLKDEAEQAQEAMQKVGRLAQIVNNMIEGGISE